MATKAVSSADEKAAPRQQGHDAPAGYSGSSLTRKLGLREGQAALLIGVPEIAEIESFAHFSSVARALPSMIERRFDYVHVFETRRVILEGIAQAVSGALKPDGMLWISWPRRRRKYRRQSPKTFCDRFFCLWDWLTSKSALSMTHGPP